jgi:hypothetical protein
MYGQQNIKEACDVFKKIQGQETFLTDSVTVTHLSSNAIISVGRIVWVTTNRCLLSDMPTAERTLAFDFHVTRSGTSATKLLCAVSAVGNTVTI